MSDLSTPKKLFSLQSMPRREHIVLLLFRRDLIYLLLILRQFLLL